MFEVTVYEVVVSEISEFPWHQAVFICHWNIAARDWR